MLQPSQYQQAVVERAIEGELICSDCWGRREDPKGYEQALQIMAMEAEMAQEEKEAAPAPRKRGPKSGEPTQKRDFRFPVRLLEALKAASEEDGQTMTEFLMSLLKSDKRIQRKLENVMTEECEV